MSGYPVELAAKLSFTYLTELQWHRISIVSKNFFFFRGVASPDIRFTDDNACLHTYRI